MTMNAINLLMRPELLGNQTMPDQGVGSHVAEAFMEQVFSPVQPTNQPMVDTKEVGGEQLIVGHLVAAELNQSAAVPTTTEFVAVQHQFDGAKQVGATLQVAELYESKYLAIGRLSYLDRNSSAGTASTAELQNATARKSPAAINELGVSVPSPTAYRSKAAQASMLISEDRQIVAQASKERERGRLAITQLPEALAPWMRRRVSVAADETNVQILVRDYGASKQELDAIVDAVLLHTQTIADGRKLTLTVNGKSVLNEQNSTGGNKDAR